MLDQASATGRGGVFDEPGTAFRQDLPLRREAVVR